MFCFATDVKQIKAQPSPAQPNMSITTIITLPKRFAVRLIPMSFVERGAITVLVNKEDAKKYFQNGLNIEYDSPYSQHKFLSRSNPKKDQH